MSITKKIFVSAFVAAFAFGFASANAAYVHSVTLKQGSTGSQVMALQQALNMTSCKVATAGVGAPGMESTTFGAKTKAAVMCFQAANGLTADGVVGPMTGAKIGMVMGGGTTTTPAPCPVGYVCTPNSTGGDTSTGDLKGGAGSIDVSSTSSSVDNTVNEGQNAAKVLGFKVKAQDSDVKLTNVKVSFANFSSNGSERLSRYADSVSVWMGSTKVGSVDVSDFSRDTGSTDVYTASISLSNAVVREDNTSNFYVAIDAADAIDSSSTASENDRGADLTVALDSIRYTDATGAILTEGNGSGAVTAGTPDTFTSGYVLVKSFDFDSSTADDSVDLKSSSSNPDDTTVQVDESDTTNDVLALAYKLDVGDKSNDVTLTTLPVHIVVASGGTDADNIDNVIDTVTVKVDGKSYEADLDSETGSNGSLTADYSVDLSGDDVSINAGDVSEVKVYLDFQEQDGNYAENTVVTASVVAADIEAETQNDDLSVTGSTSQTGADLTLNTSAANVTVTSTDHDKNNDGTSGTFTFNFTVEADNGDVDVTTSNTLYTVLGPTSGRTVTATLVNLDGDATENTPGSDYTVQDGDSNTFSLTVTITPTGTGGNGAYYVRLDQAAGTTISNKTAGPESLAF